MAKNHLLPCPICKRPIQEEPTKEEEEPVYCPDCKQIYHQRCWAENGNECKIKGCHGDTKVITTFIEKSLLNNLKMQSELKSECPNCKKSILILYRYCPHCGFEANPLRVQKSFYLFPILKFFHNNKQRLFFTLTFLLIFLFCLLPVISGLGRSTQSAAPPTQTEVRYFTRTPFFTATSHKYPAATTRPTMHPTNTLIPTQIKLEPIPADYKCTDKDKIELQAGAWAIIGKYDVNLREKPVVSDVNEANVIRILYEGERVQVIGGPECSHNGTWWKVKTKSGEVGWSRELISASRLLFRINQ